MQRLASESQLDATMMVPSALASSNLAPLRVLFAAHGAGGSGVDHCEYWNKLVAEDVLIVCPTGTLLRKNDEQGGAYFQSHLTLRAELDALIAALQSHFKGRLTPGEWLYLGYSQGATMGALALLEDAPLVGKSGLSQLVLIEGGGENWNLSRSKKFKEAGGLSVALVCGTPSCGRHGQGNIPHLEKAGLTATLIEVEGGGHAYWGLMTEGVRSALSQAGYAK
jgi:pimeloyl-ACP methyl ester carboxylesterase